MHGVSQSIHRESFRPLTHSQAIVNATTATLKYGDRKAKKMTFSSKETREGKDYIGTVNFVLQAP